MANLLRIVTVLCVGLHVSNVPARGFNQRSEVTLENNEYKGLVVAIDSKETEDADIIEIVKEMFINGSSYLYNATKKRAFFNEVTILIPETWSHHPSYTSSGTATFHNADVIIANLDPHYTSAEEFVIPPYTKQFEGCGKQGLYIHITSHFLKNYRHLQKYYGNYGRILVHEWGHYRWGLFDEYPDVREEHDGAWSFYFSDSSQTWIPVSCSDEWRYVPIKYTGNQYIPYRRCNGDQLTGYEDGCTALPSKHQAHVSGSIMNSHLTYDELVNFCDNKAEDLSYLHNSEAPTNQNKRCEGRSNWEVMREHSDFKDHNNPPRDVDDVTPTFHVVRSRPARVVLLLDTSGSMSENDRYLKLADAAKTYVLTVARLGTSVAIVDFDGNARIISNLTELTSDQVRASVANMIPVKANGGTCVGCGFEAALKLLTDKNHITKGGRIMLLTSGKDDAADFTESMRQMCIRRKISVDVIIMGDFRADPSLLEVSGSTGGRLFFQTESLNSHFVMDAFELPSEDAPDWTRRLEIYSDVKTFEIGETELTGFVLIDETVGQSTAFDFKYFYGNSTATRLSASAFDVIIISPSGVKYTATSAVYSDELTFKKITITIEDIAEQGIWEYMLQNQVTNETYAVIVHVTSMPLQDTEPITVSLFLSGTNSGVNSKEPLAAYADVRQGYRPVIFANVIATVETPTGTVELQMYDNGAGADLNKKDGVYSRYFTQFTGEGLYRFKVHVESNGDTAVSQISTNLQFSWIGIFIDPEALLAGELPDIPGNDSLTIALPGEPLKELEGVAAPNFTRGVSGGASRVAETPVGWSASLDSVPPSQITDLEVTSTEITNGSVSVKFTAPGDDLDFGNAHHYVIKWANSSHQLRKNRTVCPIVEEDDVIVGNLSSPAPFGTVEEFTFFFFISKDVETTSFMIAVYAVDEADHEGPTSNIQQATFRRYIPPPLEEIYTTLLIKEPDIRNTTTEEMKTTKGKVFSQKTTVSKVDKNENLALTRATISIMSVGAFLVLVIVIGATVLIGLRHQLNKRRNLVVRINVASAPANSSVTGELTLVDA